MSKLINRMHSIQWKLTLTYMVATLLMIFLVELMIAISIDRYAFSNPEFIFSSARFLNDSSVRIRPSLLDPMDINSIKKWVNSNQGLTQLNPRFDQVFDNKIRNLPQPVSITPKPLAFSQQKSTLTVIDERGVILASSHENTFTDNTLLVDLVSQQDGAIIRQVLEDPLFSILYTIEQDQYASLVFPIIVQGQKVGAVFAQYYQPTLLEQIRLAFESYLPNLPVFLVISICIGILFGSVLAHSFTKRISTLIQATTSWGKGDFSQPIKMEGGDEISLLSNALNDMVREFQDLIQSKQMLAAMQERNRLARELHDSVKQQIFSITMNLATINSLWQKDPQKARAHLETTAQIAKQARTELSTLIDTLHPAQLQNQSLEDALRELVNIWQKQNAISVVFRVHGKKPELSPEIEQAIYRITQEALSNIARHSQASAASITVDFQPSFIQLQISDNGIGFDAQKVQKGLGLYSIKERALSNHGTFDMESTSTGTTLSITIPARIGGENGKA